MTTIELNKIEQINLSELGWRFELHYNEELELITIETNSGYQIIFRKGKLAYTNILREMRLISNSIEEGQDIWFY